jgi:hypothetical protein
MNPLRARNGFVLGRVGLVGTAGQDTAGLVEVEALTRSVKRHEDFNKDHLAYPRKMAWNSARSA